MKRIITQRFLKKKQEIYGKNIFIADLIIMVILALFLCWCFLRPFHDHSPSIPCHSEVESDLNDSEEDLLPEKLRPYRSVVSRFKRLSKQNNNIGSFYFLYDITGDSIPEMWIISGDSDPQTRLYIYTVKKTTGDIPALIYEKLCGYISFSLPTKLERTVLGLTGRGEGWIIIKYNYDRGKIIASESEVFTYLPGFGNAVSEDERTQELIKLLYDSDTADIGLHYKELN